MSHENIVHRAELNDLRFLEPLIERLTKHPGSLQANALATLRACVRGTAQPTLNNRQVMTFFERGSADLRLAVPLHSSFVNGGDLYERTRASVIDAEYLTRADMANSLVEYAFWHARTHALWTLTHGSVCFRVGRRLCRLPATQWSNALLRMSDHEERDTRTELFRAVHLSGLVNPTLPPDADPDSLRDVSRRNPRWLTQAVLGAHRFKVTIFATVEPLVWDRDDDMAYFHVSLSVRLPRGRLAELGHWNPHSLSLLWEQVGQQLDERVIEVAAVARAGVTEPPSLRPRWDESSRALRVGPYVVRQYRQAGSNQFLVLAAFEEEGWSGPIFDPLPDDATRSAKERLRETVRALNESHLVRGLLRFRMDGTGQRVMFSLNSSKLPRSHTDKPETHP
jgi:hypothetical protein